MEPVGGRSNDPPPRAAPGLVELAPVHAPPEEMRSCSAHHAGEPRQEAIPVVGRIAPAVGIGPRGRIAGAELGQVMPVGTAAGPPTHLQPRDQPDPIRRPAPSAGSRWKPGRPSAV